MLVKMCVYNVDTNKFKGYCRFKDIESSDLISDTTPRNLLEDECYTCPYHRHNKCNHVHFPLDIWGNLYLVEGDWTSLLNIANAISPFMATIHLHEVNKVLHKYNLYLNKTPISLWFKLKEMVDVTLNKNDISDDFLAELCSYNFKI